MHPFVGAERATRDVRAHAFHEIALARRSGHVAGVSGEHLAEELRQHGITAAELSRQIDVPVNRITGIINGQRGITADTALRLAKRFGNPARYWMGLQADFDLEEAKQS